MNKIITIAVLTGAVQVSAVAEDVKPFSMDGEFGIILTTGNTETTSVKGRLNGRQELENWSNDYLFEALYKQDDVNEGTDGGETTVTTAQRWFLSGQANYKLDNPNNRLFGFASYEDDRFGSFDFQATLAGGWNSQLWSNDDSVFSYSVGPGYSFADTVEGEDVSGFIVRAAADYQWNISETAVFKQIVSTEIGADNTKSKSETSVSAQLNGSLSMKFSILLNHNTDVAEDVDNLDTETAVTLVYTFF